ncbi:MAG: bidirectional hydrogenase complex protein HoxE [Synechococcales cyanobacterium]
MEKVSARQPWPSVGDPRDLTLRAEIRRHQFRQDTLIEILHQAQALFGCLSEPVLTLIARELKLPLSRVFGVATFYHLFSLQPAAIHTCTVCLGSACYVEGGEAILQRWQQHLGIPCGTRTPDGQIALTTVYCIGACGIAPAVVLDEQVIGRETPASADQHLREWLASLDTQSAPLPVGSPSLEPLS